MLADVVGTIDEVHNEGNGGTPKLPRRAYPHFTELLTVIVVSLVPKLTASLADALRLEGLVDVVSGPNGRCWPGSSSGPGSK